MRTSEQMRSTKETRVTVRLNLDGGDVAINTASAFLTTCWRPSPCTAAWGLRWPLKATWRWIATTRLRMRASCWAGPFVRRSVIRAALRATAAFFCRWMKRSPLRRWTLAAALSGVQRGIPGERVGGFDTCMCGEFFRAFAMNAGVTLHLNVPYGGNSHHQIEALFKAAAHALRQAVTQTGKGTLSTKGTLE